jgi:hypothetical protein
MNKYQYLRTFTQGLSLARSLSGRASMFAPQFAPQLRTVSVVAGIAQDLTEYGTNAYWQSELNSELQTAKQKNLGSVSIIDVQNLEDSD